MVLVSVDPEVAVAVDGFMADVGSCAEDVVPAVLVVPVAPVVDEVWSVDEDVTIPDCQLGFHLPVS